MQQKRGSLRKRVDFVDGRLQRGRNVAICGLVESHVAVADLNETQLARRGTARSLCDLTQAIGLQYPAMHYAERTCSSPSHALQKSTAVHAVVVAIDIDDFL